MPNDWGMVSGPADARPLTPVDFLDRAVPAFAHRPAAIWHDRQWTYAEFAGIAAAMVVAMRGSCRDNRVHSRMPRAFGLAELPRTATGRFRTFALRATAKGLQS